MGSKLSLWIEESVATLEGLEADHERVVSSLDSLHATAESHTAKVADFDQQIALLQAEREQNRVALTQVNSRMAAETDELQELRADIEAMRAALERAAGGSGSGGDDLPSPPPRRNAGAPKPKPKPKPPGAPPAGGPTSQALFAPGATAPEREPSAKMEDVRPEPRRVAPMPEPNPSEEISLDFPRRRWRWLAVVTVIGLLVGGGIAASTTGLLDDVIERVSSGNPSEPATARTDAG